ncbi:MAG: putative metal-dependent hydrolase [Gemmatimonadota bacterium]|nr:putative metal-dependent hydrolase [Gemmatimonadota bacterium]
MSEDLSYPIGPWVEPSEVSPAAIGAAISRIAALPAAFRAAVEPLTDAQLDTPYRPGGWSVRQLAHHLPDSHLNAYVRIKLALSEDAPTIRPYDQEAWAELPDSVETPVRISLDLLTALHARWVVLLRAMSPEQWSRQYHHPETGTQRLDTVILHYAWHGDHHLAHVTRLLDRMGWW